MMPKPTDIKAFAFLDRDPQAGAAQLLRAGWTRADVGVSWWRVREWEVGVYNAFCAAEESQGEGENHEI